MSEEPGLLDIKLPADIVQRLRWATDLDGRDHPDPSSLMFDAARALVEHNPEPEPPLQTGDWVKVGGEEWIVSAGCHEGWAVAVWVDKDGRNLTFASADIEDRCDPPSDPVVRAALLRCIGREDNQ